MATRKGTYIARFRGKLYDTDSEAAYERLAAELKDYRD